MSYPNWLPELFSVNPWKDTTYEELYALFRKDFIESQPVYEGQPVWIFPEMENGKEKIFWHLTTREDKRTKERFPDLRRSERLPWVRAILDEPDHTELLIWDYVEGDGDINTYVWLKDYDFVILLKKYPNGSRRLLTSYWLDYKNAKDKLQKKYEQRI